MSVYPNNPLHAAVALFFLAIMVVGWVEPASVLNRILTGLERVRRSGRDWVSCCPAHNDRYHPSLSIAVRDGHILLHCFCGCSIWSICAALGIRVRDLFECTATDSSPEWTDKERREYAYERFWLPSRPASNTIVATYLKLRGIGGPIPTRTEGFAGWRDRRFSGGVVA